MSGSIVVPERTHSQIHADVKFPLGLTILVASFLVSFPIGLFAFPRAVGHISASGAVLQRLRRRILFARCADRNTFFRHIEGFSPSTAPLLGYVNPDARMDRAFGTQRRSPVLPFEVEKQLQMTILF